MPIFSYASSVAIAQFFTFLSLLLYTNVLSPSIYALVALFESILLLFQMFLGFSFDKGAQRYFISIGEKKVLSVALLLAISISAIIYIVTTIIVIFFYKDYYFYFNIIFFGALAYAAHAILLVKFQFTNKITSFFIFSALKPLLFLISSFYFLFYKELLEEAFINALLINSFVLFGFSILIIKPSFSYLSDSTFIKRIIKFSYPFVPILIASWFLNWSSRLFMVDHIDQSEIGVFSLAQRLGMFLFIFFQALNLAAAPQIYKFFESKKIENVKNLMNFNSALLVFLGLATFYFLPHLVTVIFPSDFSNLTIYLLPIIFINVVMGLMGLTTNFVFTYLEKTYDQMIIYLSVAFLSLSLNIALIPYFKMFGVIAALILPVIFLFFVHYFYVSMKFKKIQFSFLLVYVLLFSGFALMPFMLEVLGFNSETTFFAKASVIALATVSLVKHFLKKLI